MLRIIPRLDIKGPDLVKGIHLEGLRVLGNPEIFAEYYYRHGADELIYQDVVASLFERNSLDDLITKTSKRIFIPLTVGGGIRNLQDIERVLKAGADKVSINTAALRDPEFIIRASQKYGASTIVVAIESIKGDDGRYYAFMDNGREPSGSEVVEWALQAQSMGAGEILLTSVDRDGTGAGFDVDLASSLAGQLHIPLVVHGGPGQLADYQTLLDSAPIDGIAVASMLHYELLNDRQFDRSEAVEGNNSFVSANRLFSQFDTCGLQSLKHYLRDNQVEVRL